MWWNPIKRLAELETQLSQQDREIEEMRQRVKDLETEVMFERHCQQEQHKAIVALRSQG